MSEEICYLLLLISPTLLISYSGNLLEEWIKIQWKFFNYHIPCLCWIPATLSNIWSNISWPISRKIQINSLDVNNQHSWAIDNDFGYSTIFCITPKVSRTIRVKWWVLGGGGPYFKGQFYNMLSYVIIGKLVWQALMAKSVCSVLLPL